MADVQSYLITISGGIKGLQTPPFVCQPLSTRTLTPDSHNPILRTLRDESPYLRHSVISSRSQIPRSLREGPGMVSSKTRCVARSATPRNRHRGPHQPGGKDLQGQRPNMPRRHKARHLDIRGPRQSGGKDLLRSAAYSLANLARRRVRP
jgi:hypothetical protein